MKIYLAADHAGFELKEKVKKTLSEQGLIIEDCGAYTLDTSDDYPDFVTPCAKKVASDPTSFAIIFGASGQGEAMVANRISGVRAVVYYGRVDTVQTDAGGESLGLIESTRMHNHANVLSLGARFISEDEAKEAVAAFLRTQASEDERHTRRIGKF